MRIKSIILILAILSPIALLGQTESTEVKTSWLKENIFYQLSFGVMAHDREYAGRSYNPSVAGTIGYKYRSFLQPGLSVGYDEYSQFTTVPIGLFVNGKFIDKKKSAIYYVNAGRAIAIMDGSKAFESIDNGNFFEAGVGFRWEYDNGAFQFSVGWRQQQLITYSRDYSYLFSDLTASSSFWWPGNSPNSVTHWTMERVVFRIGMNF